MRTLREYQEEIFRRGNRRVQIRKKLHRMATALSILALVAGISWAWQMLCDANLEIGRGTEAYSYVDGNTALPGVAPGEGNREPVRGWVTMDAGEIHFLKDPPRALEEIQQAMARATEGADPEGDWQWCATFQYEDGHQTLYYFWENAVREGEEIPCFLSQDQVEALKTKLMEVAQ